MQHRHLNHEGYTLAAIDDVIARGRWADWAELRRAVCADPPVLGRVERICRARTPTIPMPSGTISGCTMSNPASGTPTPDWEEVLSAAARLQRLLPEAVLVGGTAAGRPARGLTRRATPEDGAGSERRRGGRGQADSRARRVSTRRAKKLAPRGSASSLKSYPGLCTSHAPSSPPLPRLM